jgi:hypothetical protein
MGKVKRKQCAIYNFYSAYVLAEIVARAWATRRFTKFYEVPVCLADVGSLKLARYFVG